MRRVIWAKTALADFENAITYIAKDNPVAAQSVATRVLDTVQLLADTPIGRIGRVSGTYEKYVQKTPYIIAYTLTADTLAIARVIHERRNWEHGGWPEE